MNESFEGVMFMPIAKFIAFFAPGFLGSGLLWSVQTFIQSEESSNHTNKVRSKPSAMLFKDTIKAYIY